MIQTLYTILPILLLFFQTAQGDDLIDSPIFEDRPDSKSLKEIQNRIEIQIPEKEANLKREDIGTKDSKLGYIKHILYKFLSRLNRNKRKAKYTGNTQYITRDKRKENSKNNPKWHKWTEWSTCNVTCGKGRVIRWRHCQENCDGIETEMEEMACQLPECPRKLFGVIKLKK